MSVKKHTNPVCEMHADCFANKDGMCTCLNNTDFKKDCPFYKPKSEISMEQIDADCAMYAETHGSEYGGE